MSACFHPFDRHIVCGATYEGQVVLWDTRQSGHAAAASSSASATVATFSDGRPAQSTALSTQGHAHLWGKAPWGITEVPRFGAA